MTQNIAGQGLVNKYMPSLYLIQMLKNLEANTFFFFNTLNREVEAGCEGELVGRSAFVRGPCPE